MYGRNDYAKMQKERIIKSQTLEEKRNLAREFHLSNSYKSASAIL